MYDKDTQTALNPKMNSTIPRIHPLPTSSHHQDCYVFSKESQPKPSFATTGWGVDANYTNKFMFHHLIVHLIGFHLSVPVTKVVVKHLESCKTAPQKIMASQYITMVNNPLLRPCWSWGYLTWGPRLTGH